LVALAGFKAFYRRCNALESIALGALCVACVHLPSDIVGRSYPLFAILITPFQCCDEPYERSKY